MHLGKKKIEIFKMIFSANIIASKCHCFHVFPFLRSAAQHCDAPPVLAATDTNI